LRGNSGAQKGPGEFGVSGFRGGNFILKFGGKHFSTFSKIFGIPKKRPIKYCNNCPVFRTEVKSLIRFFTNLTTYVLQKTAFFTKIRVFLPPCPQKKSTFSGDFSRPWKHFRVPSSSPRSPAQNGHCWPLSACPKKASWVISKEIHHPTERQNTIFCSLSPSVNTISGEKLLLRLFFSPADPPSDGPNYKNVHINREDSSTMSGLERTPFWSGVACQS
jgi:hypothetical protein